MITHALPIVFIVEPRMVLYYKHMLQSHHDECFFLVHVLNYKPCHRAITYKALSLIVCGTKSTYIYGCWVGLEIVASISNLHIAKIVISSFRIGVEILKLEEVKKRIEDNMKKKLSI